MKALKSKVVALVVVERQLKVLTVKAIKIGLYQ